MHEHNFDVHMISSEDEQLPLIAQREASSYTAINMKRTISPLNDVVSLIKLIKAFKRLRPGIVHTHTPKAGLLGMLAARITNVPVRLHTVAGLPLMETSGLKRKILELTEKLTYYCASQVYPNSQNLEKFILKNNFCKPDKLKVIGKGSSNGINTNYFKATADIIEQANRLKEEFLIAEDNFTFIFIGRLVKDKGIEELIRAFSNLNQKYPHIRLLLVGPFEPERDPLSKECLEEIENNPAIINAGFKNDVRPYLQLSSALVFPSYREGFPNVPMQAGCFDLPSIVTNINGCNEIIENEINGLIIPTKSVKVLLNAMERFINDKPLYEMLKGNARKIIVERYEQTHFWSLLLQEYQHQSKQHGIS
ncbi:glycosyltransferase family 4 protein [Mucilaginibacter sp. dw_454]|uniref:glycosyltransferase family 4 protein n=1 Tax=Mucilaginibacter sp. dw_454 TaxID=2720079 RepID=UPI0021068E33|nr:glycosyltransferase family 4 protein [Mucilaginibacter sp. dw_454]